MTKEMAGINAAMYSMPIGLEIFLLLLSGQIGQLIATGNKISIRELLSNIFLNVVFTAMILNVGLWQEWGEPQMIVLAGVVGVIGIRSTISFIKAAAERFS